MVNVLVTSVSNKVPLVMEVKKSLSRLCKNGKVIGADTDPKCIARYFVDEFWQMPRVYELGIEVFIDDCLSRRIKAIIPTRDGELKFFSKNKMMFIQHGILPMVSELSAIETCLDKLNFYHIGSELNFPVIQTSLDIDDIISPAYRYVVKERFGSGSRGIGLNLSKENALRHARSLMVPIFQPQVFGEEYSVDLYVMTGSKVKGAVVRKRELVVDGESQITSTVYHPSIENLACSFAERLRLFGHINLQVIEDSQNHLHIVECNPRFGGASRLSIHAGLDSFTWFLRESMGENITEIPFIRSERNKKMVRYKDDLIFDV